MRLVETITEDFASKVLRRGKKGRPRLEPHDSLTLRMDTAKHARMTDYCVEHNVSQRVFMETAGQKLLENPTASAKLIKARRKFTSLSLVEPVLKMHTLRMNARLGEALENYCIEHDVSQREFVEFAAELLVRDAEFAKRIARRRADLDLQRALYRETK